jgi:tetratricopeptide (TPR) repeat protein
MSSSIGRHLRGTAGIATMTCAAFVLVAGLGTATTMLKNPLEQAASVAPAVGDSEQVVRLKDYARSVGVGGSAPTASHGKSSAGPPLADVETMIERLAKRLAAAPNDVKGWRMLGWSYFHTDRYKEAADAFAKAVALDPASTELKKMYEEANRAANGGAPMQAAETRGAPAHKDGRLPTPEQMQAIAEMPAEQRQAMVRAMVDGLATRLDSDPRDVEGWTRLMRSRVVLGEKDVAATMLRKALDVFKDDAAASARISATASELGLNTQ